MASKTCIIFGTSGGIGTALVRMLSEAGAELILAGRNESKLAALAESGNRMRLPHSSYGY